MNAFVKSLPFVLGVVLSASGTIAQVPTQHYSRQSESAIQLSLHNGVDTLIAGDDGLVGWYSSAGMTYVDVPAPVSNIRTGISADSVFYLVETSGSILRVTKKSIERVRPQEHVLGLAVADGGFMAICTRALIWLDADLNVTRTQYLDLPSPFVVGAVSNESGFAVTEDSLMYVVRPDGSVRQLERSDEFIRSIYVDDDIVTFSSNYFSYFYSQSRDREVGVALKDADVPGLVSANGKRFVGAVDRSTGRYLLQLNLPLGNTNSSPIYVCEREDTTLTVLYRYSPTAMSYASEVNAVLGSSDGELLFGRGGKVIRRAGIGLHWPAGKRTVETGATIMQSGSVARSVTEFDGGVAKRFVRVFNNKGLEQEIVVRTQSADLFVQSFSMTWDDSSVVALNSDTVIRITVGAKPSVEVVGVVPQVPSTAEPLVVGANIVANSRLLYLKSVPYSADTGRSWQRLPGNSMTIGGDGSAYTKSGSVLYRFDPRNLSAVQDSLVLVLKQREVLTTLSMASDGIWALVETVDESLPIVSHRLLHVRNGIVTVERLYSTELHRVNYLVAEAGKDTLVVMPTVGKEYSYSTDQGVSWIRRNFAVPQIWPTYPSIGRHCGRDSLGRVLIGIGMGELYYIAAFSLSTPTSVDDDPNLQWVAIRNAYPNPAERVLNVTISSLPTADYATWRFGLYRLDGSLAVDCKPYTAPWTMTSTVQTISVPIAGLPQGMYYLASVNRGYAESRQVVVVR